MKFTLDLGDPQTLSELTEHVCAAVTGAICRPEFLGALLADPGFRQLFKESLTPDKIWLSYEQVQEFLSLPRSTFYEWKERHKGKLSVSYSPGEKTPRIKFSSVLAVMEESAISAAPTLPGIPPTPSALPPPKPVQAGPRSRLPIAALRDVALTARNG